MADDNEGKPAQANPPGCLSRLLVLSLLLCAVGLGFAVWFMAQPQDLSDIHGYTPDSRSLLRRDIRMLLQSSLDRKHPVTITEGEINQWLRGVLKPKQGGLLGDKVSLDGVWVRLEDGRAEVILERKVLGRPFTVSMYLQIEPTEKTVDFHGGSFHEYLPYPKCGGRFGKLRVPQGFLLLVMPAFKKLAAAFPEEFHLAFDEMTRIKIEEGHLTLDPREPQPTVTGPP